MKYYTITTTKSSATIKESSKLCHSKPTRTRGQHFKRIVSINLTFWTWKPRLFGANKINAMNLKPRADRGNVSDHVIYCHLTNMTRTAPERMGAREVGRPVQFVHFSAKGRFTTGLMFGWDFISKILGLIFSEFYVNYVKKRWLKQPKSEHRQKKNWSRQQKS